MGWKSAVLDALAVGAADVEMHLDRGICQFSPIDTTVADGRLRLTPQIRLDRNRAVLALPAEKVLTQVQLSTEICGSWLKFIAPMLADATQVDGKCSLEIVGGTLPLSSPRTGELAGVLTIHQAQIRPGASALQVLSTRRPGFDPPFSVVPRATRLAIRSG